MAQAESSRRTLQLIDVSPSLHRGRLLTANEVAELIYRSPEWVRRNVPFKITLGHSTVRWYEADILDWIDSQREG